MFYHVNKFRHISVKTCCLGPVEVLWLRYPVVNQFSAFSTMKMVSTLFLTYMQVRYIGQK